MANHALLNNVDHRDLRVRSEYSPALGDAVMCTLAMPSELRHVQAEYPVFLHRESATGRLLPMAMFGLEEGQNLFLDEGGWQASYVPLMMRRGPFLIGFQERGEAASGQRDTVVAIDLDNPRVGGEGERLFEAYGGNSAYTESVIDVLREIDRGQGAIDALSATLLAHELAEPFTLDIQLDDGERLHLTQFLTVNEERLAALEGEVLAAMSRSGQLQAAYMILASMANLPKLIALRNRRR